MVQYWVKSDSAWYMGFNRANVKSLYKKATSIKLNADYIYFLYKTGLIRKIKSSTQNIKSIGKYANK